MRGFVLNERSNSDDLKISVSQGDFGYDVKIISEAVHNYVQANDNYRITVRGKRSDGAVFEENVSIDNQNGNEVLRFYLVPDMTESYGEAQCELIFRSSQDDEQVCLGKFALIVEETPGYGNEPYKLPYIRFIERTIFGTIVDDTIETVGYYAFRDCKRIKSIEFQRCVEISASAFMNCTSLQSVAFPRCSYIGNAAFYGCSKLSNIVLLSNNVVSMNGNATMIFDTVSSISIFVPESLVSNYKNDTKWRTVSSRIFPYVG